MRVYKQVTIPPLPAKVEDQLTAVRCDVCKKETRELPSWSGTNWTMPYGIEEVCIRRKSGSHYPDDEFSGTMAEYDICDECFDKHVVPFLTQLGAAPSTKERG